MRCFGFVPPRLPTLRADFGGFQICSGQRVYNAFHGSWSDFMRWRDFTPPLVYRGLNAGGIVPAANRSDDPSRPPGTALSYKFGLGWTGYAAWSAWPSAPVSL